MYFAQVLVQFGYVATRINNPTYSSRNANFQLFNF